MGTQPTTRTQKTSQHRKKHIGLKIILSIVILIVAVLAVLPFFINPIADSLVKQQVAAKFGNKLKIGSVTVSFLTGAVVKVNQIELAEAPGYGKGSLVKAGSINIRVALMPLLKKQLIIHDITIVRPDIHIIQYRNGNMNLDYYLSKFAGKSTESASRFCD
jgi:AsmA protein